MAMSDLLKHFDDDTATRLAHMLNSQAITEDHVKEMIRLTSSRPDYRDPDALDSLLEDAEEMDASAFRVWVENSLQAGDR